MVQRRVSLSGMQPKMCLYKDPKLPINDRSNWFLPNSFGASNFIIKPAHRKYRHLVLNEYITMKLATSCNISIPQIYITDEEDPYFIRERFDRQTRDGKVKRLQAEDVCQLINWPSRLKYEEQSGPSVSTVITCLTRYCDNAYADANEFLAVLLFNYFVGNCDAHGKNFSLLRTAGGEVRLSPAYDLLSTTYYATLTRSLSMKIGSQYHLDTIAKGDFRTLAEQFNMSEDIINNTFSRILSDLNNNINIVREQTKQEHSYNHLAIDSLCDHLLEEVNNKRKVRMLSDLTREQ
jgi:serine/threonine-protein kinase HipA